jgi:hypothetical protein
LPSSLVLVFVIVLLQIEYAPGKKNKADGLSWCPDYEPDLIAETDKQVLILPEYFINAVVMLDASSYLEHLQHKQPLDEEIAARLQDPDSHWNETAWVIHDAGGRIIIPSNVGLQTEIIQLTHDVPHIGHPRIGKTVSLIKGDCWWPGLRKDVAEYVKLCIPCQHMKVYPEKAHRLLNLIVLLSVLWEQAMVDFITQLPHHRGMTQFWLVLTVSYFMAMMLNISATGNTQLFHHNMWKHHEWMQKIITNQGTQFSVKFTWALNDLLGVETTLSTTHHPQMASRLIKS